MTSPPWRPPPPKPPPKPPPEDEDRPLAIVQDVISLLIGSAASIWEVFFHQGGLRPEVLLFAAGLLGVPFVRRLKSDD